MTFDSFAKVAVGEVICYVLLTPLTFFVVRKQVGREGWNNLLVFCVVRLTVGIITLIYKSQVVPKESLVIAATVLSSLGLSPLLLATNAFLRKIASYGLPTESRTVLQVTRILLFGGILLSTIGGILAVPSHSQNTIDTGRKLTRAATIFFLTAYIVLLGVNLWLWKVSNRIPIYHRRLLAGTSLAFAPLLVRIVYSLESVFASSLNSKWSPIRGEWWLFVALALAMECIVAFIYLFVGLTAHLNVDDAAKNGQSIELKGQTLIPGSSDSVA
ncbi:hypothetical protein M422DRAFT_244898 [Sphaerobolus stellatus SS14]|nr:hypothetical protein M422DRAFT_244898 [Sphaerobolus stellatus SS14]